MNGTSPFLTRLGIGGVRLDFAEGGSRWYVLDGGFAQMQRDQLSLLTDGAIAAETLSVSEAEAELAEATARVPATAPIARRSPASVSWPSPNSRSLARPRHAAARSDH